MDARERAPARGRNDLEPLPTLTDLALVTGVEDKLSGVAGEESESVPLGASTKISCIRWSTSACVTYFSPERSTADAIKRLRARLPCGQISLTKMPTHTEGTPIESDIHGDALQEFEQTMPILERWVC